VASSIWQTLMQGDGTLLSRIGRRDGRARRRARAAVLSLSFIPSRPRSP